MENRQIVVFKLMGHEFGVDIKKVLEILNYESVRPVPDAPNYIDGIINVRGTVYLVFNLRKRLNMSPIEEIDGTKFILLYLKENKVGLLVDSVCEILSVQEEAIERAPQVIEKNKVSCIDYIVKQDNRMIVVLNIDAILSGEENLFVQGVSDEEDYCSNAE
ncbi:MAG: purine-binding chemotaxis protein CheW [Cellulosilyticum sp.]|nr:purine-binding chemotaxis protein CheW [Cellulosilyticum sp.]